VALEGYHLTGPPSDPVTKVFNTPNGQASVAVIDAPIGFTFQGEEFDVTGSYAFVDGVMHWFTECR
jgi:hypothetical protein